MKVGIDPFEANFAELIFLTVQMVDVEGGSAREIITKEIITESLAKSGNVVTKKKLKDKSRTMLVNMLNMSEKANAKFDSEYEIAIFKNEQKLIYPQVGEDLLNFLLCQIEQGGNVSLCPCCSAIYDRGATHEFMSH